MKDYISASLGLEVWWKPWDRVERGGRYESRCAMATTKPTWMESFIPMDGGKGLEISRGGISRRCLIFLMFKVLGFDNLFLFELNNQNLYVSVLIILKIFI